MDWIVSGSINTPLPFKMYLWTLQGFPGISSNKRDANLAWKYLIKLCESWSKQDFLFSW